MNNPPSIEPIPAECAPLVERIRQRVPRPLVTPVLQIWSFNDTDKWCYELIFPSSSYISATTLCSYADAGGSEYQAQRLAFQKWWSRQTDPKAMDLIWPVDGAQ